MAKKRVKRGSSGKRPTNRPVAAPKKRAARKTKKAASTSTAKSASKSKAKATKRAQSTRKVAKRLKPVPKPSGAVATVKPSAENTNRHAPKRSGGLTRREIDEFRRLLLVKRTELVGDVSHLHAEAMRQNRQDAAGDLSSMPIHMADIGTDNYEQEFTLGLIESERALLREIDEALHRIDDGTYGLCVATGQPIGKKRLKANPWAKYCYEYKLAQEKGMMRRP